MYNIINKNLTIKTIYYILTKTCLFYICILYMYKCIYINFRMATELANKKAEREALRGVIQQWNANRLDLFELSEPNEVNYYINHVRFFLFLDSINVYTIFICFFQDLEFHGVMRFYFQDSGQKVATKCIRVASDATSQAVIETLIEKFRPDMRMLSVPEYALYEIHENGGKYNKDNKFILNLNIMYN